LPEGARWATDDLHTLGRLAGSGATGEQARLANEYPPVLRSHDRWGNRIDEVEFHPAWHALMTLPWAKPARGAMADQRPGAHVARAAKFYVWAQAEAGHGCPISMTYAAIPALRHAPALAGGSSPCSRPAATTRVSARPRPRTACWPGWP
jgi:putative acyl-CoA dehydrogenase